MLSFQCSLRGVAGEKIPRSYNRIRQRLGVGGRFGVRLINGGNSVGGLRGMRLGMRSR